MRRLFAVAILIGSVLGFSVQAYAESNPLLDVFEAISVGQKGTLVKDIDEALSLQNKNNDNFYRNSVGYVRRKIIKLEADKKVMISWTWWNAAFDGSKVSHPTAVLEVLVDDNGDWFSQRILDASYHYTFMDFKRSLNIFKDYK